MAEQETFEGGCSCGAVRYRLMSPPMFVHCCHCRLCQRQTGSAFALNALIEADRVVLLSGAPEPVDVETPSGKGQRILRCPACRIALWSHYGGAGEKVSFIRAGTLDEPARFPPDIHIHTVSKHPWVALPDGVPAFPGFYDRGEVWPEESYARWRAARG